MHGLRLVALLVPLGGLPRIHAWERCPRPHTDRPRAQVEDPAAGKRGVCHPLLEPQRLQPDVRVVLETTEGSTAWGLRLHQLDLVATAEESRLVGHLGPDLLHDDLDVAEAVRLMKVATQSAATNPRTGQIDMDLITTGRTALDREQLGALAGEVRELLEAAPRGRRLTLAELRSRVQQQSEVEVAAMRRWISEARRAA